MAVFSSGRARRAQRPFNGKETHGRTEPAGPIASYLISLYCSLAVLTPDALALLLVRLRFPVLFRFERRAYVSVRKTSATLFLAISHAKPSWNVAAPLLSNPGG